MHRVIIADDERLIREGLRSLIDWESCGFEIPCLARDGVEAFERFKSRGTELIIADIRMPGMDGLELLKAVRERDEKVRFLIVSGYADFEYAKRAMDYRADGYLLKPIEEGELLAKLGRIREAIEAEERAARRDHPSLARRRGDFVRAVLQGKTRLDEKARAEAAELGLERNRYQVLLVLIEGGEGGEPEKAQEMREFLKDEIEAERAGIAFADSPYLGVLMGQSRVKDESLKRLAESLEAASLRFGASWAAAAGGIVGSLEEARVSYETALLLMKNRFLAEEGAIIESMPPAAPGTPNPPPFDIEKTSLKFSCLADSGLREQLPGAVRSMGEELAALGMGEAQIKAVFLNTAIKALDTLKASRPGSAEALSLATSLVVGLQGKRSLSSLERSFTELFIPVMDSIREANPESLMERITGLIERAYSENLSLESLASVFGYNSAYLGKLFKAKTGEYFTVAVDKVRIAKAKELLRQGMKVHQVAKAVGYSYVDYFNEKFRKYTGLSPSAFRSGGVGSDPWASGEKV